MAPVILALNTGERVTKLAFEGPARQWIHFGADIGQLCEDDGHWGIFVDSGQVDEGLRVLTQEN